MPHVLTIDLEAWYHGLGLTPAQQTRYDDRIAPTVCRLLDILKRTGTRATFFVLGVVAEHSPDLVRTIARDGHEIASHGYAHEFVYRQSPAAFERDVARSLAVLEPLAGQPIRGYRAPYFSITRESLWALPVLRDLGITYDSSIFPILNHRYGIPGAPRQPYTTAGGLLELPIATERIIGINIPCGGGAYFRILPYGLTRWLLRRIEARGERIVFYLHPWELDPHHPRIRSQIRGTVKVTHYWGLDRAEARFTRLLADFRFGPVILRYNGSECVESG
ncbi:MAG: DUF3473 domain-containing protein [Anaerolineae bacterium]|nr:DUF3473 domain-containing protein [Anaerolineae bacterium]